MPHSTRKRRSKTEPQPKAEKKAPQKAVRTFGLGERNPETMRAESPADNARGTRKWGALLKAVKAPGGMTGVKTTGYGG